MCSSWMSKPVGLYVHVPFCIQKCPYCDFYSLPVSDDGMNSYTEAVRREIVRFVRLHPGVSADTVYFGGGTPSLLGEARLCSILHTLTRSFCVSPDAEITLEVNPGDSLRTLLQEVRRAGWNRLSIGMQSASDEELQLLGRRHTAAQTAACVEDALTAGFSNFSLDLMLAIPAQTEESICRSIASCAAFGASHVSAYLLKIEAGTPYSRCASTLSLPDEEETASRYLLACTELERHGFAQYEISNFAKPGKQSRHNLKYWHDAPYLGFGPAAHSFFEGRRFFYPRNLQTFCETAAPVSDGEGGGFEEYAMLALRLREGLCRAACAERFGEAGTAAFLKVFQKAKCYMAAGLVDGTPESVALTREGFLVSNALLAELLSE